MQSKIKERWLQLCALAAIEQDSKKFLKLVEEINRLFQEKEERLKKPQSLAPAAVPLEPLPHLLGSCFDWM